VIVLGLSPAVAIMLTAAISLAAAAAIVSSDTVGSRFLSVSGTGVMSGTGIGVPRVGNGGRKGGVGGRARPLTSMEADAAAVGAGACTPAGSTLSASARPTQLVWPPWRPWLSPQTEP